MENINTNKVPPEQLINTAILILGEIPVPVRFKDSISAPIEKCMSYLYIAAQGIEDRKTEVKANVGEPEPESNPESVVS